MAADPPRRGRGRPKGVPNKITADVKVLAQQYGAQAIKTLASIMVKSGDEKAQIAAAKELLDRGYGKSTQSTEITGKDGGEFKGFIVDFKN